MPVPVAAAAAPVATQPGQQVNAQKLGQYVGHLAAKAWAGRQAAAQKAAAQQAQQVPAAQTAPTASTGYQARAAQDPARYNAPGEVRVQGYSRGGQQVKAYVRRAKGKAQGAARNIGAAFQVAAWAFGQGASGQGAQARAYADQVRKGR